MVSYFEMGVERQAVIRQDRRKVLRQVESFKRRAEATSDPAKRRKYNRAARFWYAVAVKMQELGK